MKRVILMRRERHNIKTRILITFSGLLFLSFLSVSVTFNIAVRQYIYSTAVTQLNDAINSTTFITIESQYPKSETPNNPNPPKNLFRIQSNAFVVNELYEFSYPTPPEMESDVLETQQDIIQKLKFDNITLRNLKNMEIVTQNGYYYLTAVSMAEINGQEGQHMVFYVDVTGLTRFAESVNMLMFILVSAIWFIAVVISTILSSSIAKPIRRLNEFALRMGEGNFAQYNFSFREMELDNLNKSLNQAAKQLEIYDSDQKTFFQNASHELRTPLMSIKCYAEGIVYGVMEPEKAGRIILEETDRLAEMVDDLLYISKIDNISPVSTAEKVDLRNVVYSCAESQRVIAEKNGLSFKFDMDQEPVMLLCVEKLIMRAVSNLISNALRYAASEITLSCHKKQGNIEIAVTDDGKGIEPDAMPHVFERFYKGTDGKHGIGLSIVKSIAAQHGGSVSVQNTGKGAAFTLTFPS